MSLFTPVQGIIGGALIGKHTFTLDRRLDACRKETDIVGFSSTNTFEFDSASQVDPLAFY